MLPTNNDCGLSPPESLTASSNGGEGKLAQTNIPMLADFCLSDTCDNDFCHKFTSLMSFREVHNLMIDFLMIASG